MSATAADASPPEAPVGLTGLLAETLAVQCLGTTAILIVPALAPLIAPDLGVPTSMVGYQISLLYVAGMFASVIAGALVTRFGPCRISQTAMGLHATSCALASIPSLWSMLAATLVGGFAYGLINPSASDLLMRHSPPARRNLIFSFKQTGVPLGGVVAGLAGPQIALPFGWPAALLAVAGGCLVVAALSQIGRARLDSHRLRGQMRLFSLGALRLVVATPALRWIAASSFFFSSMQLCAITFLVVLLVEDLGFSLVEAGALLAAVQVGGAVGRVLWGQVADMVGDGLAVLFGIALVMAAASATIMFATPAWPPEITASLFIVLGLSAVGWNGVYLSEVARQAPAGLVSAVTGASMFFTFTGVVFGPVIFSEMHNATGTYVGSYGFLTALALAGALMVAINRWTRGA
ncbi:MFS transporter [Aquabacter spiritensis]|uniref:Putative MFS family arabinose efflux permease n=1 Tax=Aquabacter spiritensis TaxID=933073 RepID=A0A4R3LZM0_9HYPH|nr:MFS transporter [Aquabacter spiritensis]TCT06211.1 putative MFS family arabinose efflux permease [Aquabacter spiritensis]